MLSHFRFICTSHKCFNLCFLAFSSLLLPVSLNKLDWWALQLRPVTVILHPKPSVLQNFMLQNANHLIWDVFTSPRGPREAPGGQVAINTQRWHLCHLTLTGGSLVPVHVTNTAKRRQLGDGDLAGGWWRVANTNDKTQGHLLLE